MLLSTSRINTLVKFVEGKYQGSIGIVHKSRESRKEIRTLYYSGIVFLPRIELQNSQVKLIGSLAKSFANMSSQNMEFYDIIPDDIQEILDQEDRPDFVGKIICFDDGTTGFTVIKRTHGIYDGLRFLPYWTHSSGSYPRRTHHAGVSIKSFQASQNKFEIRKELALA